MARTFTPKPSKRPKGGLKTPVSMADYDKVLEQFDINNDYVKERLHWFAVDTTEKILKNMQEMAVYPFRDVPDQYADKYTGRLERSIHWTIVNNAGGDSSLVEFYYMCYGRFLELSASGWLLRKHGSITAGMVPEMTNKRGVQVGSRPWRAKPFINSEIRRGAQKLVRRMAKKFAYEGGMHIFHAVVTADGQRGADENLAMISDGFMEYINSLDSRNHIFR